MAGRPIPRRFDSATTARWKRTLIVGREGSAWMQCSHLQILWLFPIPMATSLALTRCAISIFFIRTLYTRMCPWLRRVGTFRDRSVLPSFLSKSLFTFLVAYCCVFLSAGLGLSTVLGMLLHCRPIEDNYTIPLENSLHCFKLKPLMITRAAIGVAIDSLTWMLPHCVVWRLQLRLSHKLAISAIFALGLLYRIAHLCVFSVFINKDLGISSLVHCASRCLQVLFTEVK